MAPRLDPTTQRLIDPGLEAREAAIMAITHHFHDPNNIAAGGTWKHDYGQTICSWSWDAAKKELTVTCGAKGKKFDLSQHGDQNFTDAKLRERLPALAIEAAGTINGTKCDV
jgi:hypothetical protein